jgi:hypothetical protein
MYSKYQNIVNNILKSNNLNFKSNKNYLLMYDKYGNCIIK